MYDIVTNDDVTDWRSDVACNMLDIPKLPHAPATVRDGLDGPDRLKWWDAIKKELDQMSSIGAIKIAKVQYGRSMKMKMILKTKYDNEFNIVYKARLVVCGYSQVYLRDYKGTNAPTVPVNAVFLVLHIVAHRKYYVATFDVTAVFLQPVNDYENYAYLPDGIYKDRKVLVQVVKSVYGEKQSAMLWYKMFDDILVRLMGFICCPVAPYLYTYNDKGNIIIVTIYVDDGTLYCISDHLMDQFISEVQKHIPKVTLVRNIQKYIGITTQYDSINSYVDLSQSVYIDEKFTDVNYTEENIPMCPS
jgi:hypothetical protein